jgi:hypothetical protein
VPSSRQLVVAVDLLAVLVLMAVGVENYHHSCHSSSRPFLVLDFSTTILEGL